MAFLIDHVLFCALFGLLISVVAYPEMEKLPHHPGGGLANNLTFIYQFLVTYPLVLVLLAMSHWLYFAGFESSGFQATPGKLALRFSLVSGMHRPFTFWQASARYLCKIILLPFFGLSYWVGLWSLKKQFLHDQLCNCLHMSR